MEGTGLIDQLESIQLNNGSGRQLRILHVVGGMSAGGIETWLINILRSIDRSLFQIDFLVHTDQPCFYDEEIRSLGSKIIPCSTPSNPWLYSRNFRKILREHGPYDIVHSQVYLYDGFVLRLADRENVPVKISHIHPLTDINQTKPFRLIYRWVMCRLIAKYATHILCPSKNTLENFQKICDVSNQQTSILYNGVDLEKFDRAIDKIAIRKKNNLPLDRFIVIYVARFDPHKNHAQIFRIAEKMYQSNQNVHFVLIGSNGELLKSVQEKVEQHDNISMITGVQDISDLLRAADLFFFPSLEEGFGVVAIEAAAAGLPIVATDLSTIREACCESHHVFMCPPNDDLAAINNILTIVNNQELRQTLSLDAVQWARNFSINKSLNSLISIYSSNFYG
jgi:glycosyltransferase involved in cell wall biosynthesis